MDRLLTTPFISNAASARGVQPLLPRTPKLGTFVRIVQWNSEEGIEYDAINAAFTDPTRFAKLLDSSAYPRGGQERRKILQQVVLMKQADVIVLNEVDWGMKRTDYRNAAADLATALRMNYAYGVEFVEVDPIALGTEGFEEVSAEDRVKLETQIAVDKSRYRGLHGSAILSRFSFGERAAATIREPAARLVQGRTRKGEATGSRSAWRVIRFRRVAERARLQRSNVHSLRPLQRHSPKGIA